MNKKGFTLVEMLAVIALLGIIGTIAITSITGVQRTSNMAMYAEKVQLATDAAVKYYENKEHKSEIADAGKVVTIQNLIDNKIFMTEEEDADGNKAVINPFDSSNVNQITICVTTKYQRVYACVLRTDDNYNFLKDIYRDDTLKFDAEPGVEVKFMCPDSTCR